MESRLSISKISVPRVRDVLERPRLIEELRRHEEKRLTLILGQAAQGKSTLAASYVNHSEGPSAWLNLDSDDSDPVNCFYGLVHSLKRTLGGADLTKALSHPSLMLGPREEKPLHREWLRSLWDSIDQPVRVVLDGLDRLPPDAPSYQFLQVLIDDAPENVHLMLLSRERPPLDLHDLRMRREAHFIQNEELAFTADEVGEYLRRIKNLRFNREAVRHIHRVTEGWAGGLVVLCESIASLSEDEREKFILGAVPDKFKGEMLRYFGDKIFASARREVQELLIHSSIQEVVEPAFLRELMGVEEADEIFEELSRRHLFIHTVQDGRKGLLYRYHQLFRDFLLAKFKSVLSREQQGLSYLRAGLACQRRGEVEEAIRYYLQAGEFRRAAAAIEEIGGHLLESGRTGDLGRWIECLPEELIESNPWLMLYLCTTRRFTAVKENIAKLPRVLSAFEESGEVRGELLALAYLIEAQLFQGYYSMAMDSLLRKAESLIESINSDLYPYERATLWFQIGLGHFLSTGNPTKSFWACRNSYLLGKALGHGVVQLYALIYAISPLSVMGEFDLVAEVRDEIDGMLETISSSEARAMYFINYSGLLSLQGKLDEADRIILMCQEQTETHGLLYLHPVALLYNLFLRAHAEQFEQAQEIGSYLLHLCSIMGNHFLEGCVLLYLGISWYRAESFEKARELLARSINIFASKETSARYHLNAGRVTMNLALHRLKDDGKSDRELMESLAHFKEVGSPLHTAESHFTIAILKGDDGLLDDASAHLAAGFKIAEQKHFDHFFFLGPKDMVRACGLALELEVEEAVEYSTHLLTGRFAHLAGAELERLSRHQNAAVARRAREAQQIIHRSKAPRLRIEALGKFRVLRGDHVMDRKEWKGTLPRLLLQALIARGAGAARKEAILEDVWPEGSPAVVEKSFKVILHRLRKALEPDMDKTFGSSYLLLSGDRLSLDGELCRVDVDEFIELAQQGAKQELSGDLAEALHSYGKAVELYGGDFLAEELYLPWAQLKREQVRTVYFETLLRMAVLHEKRGAFGKAITCCKQIIRNDPFMEEAYQRLMGLYQSKGMRNAAIKLYTQYREALRKELQTEPDQLTTALYQKILDSP